VDLALGDLLGSSLLNLLILGGLDLMYRGPTRMLAATSAAHAISALVSITQTAICLLFLLLPLEFTVGGLGPGPIVLVFTYLFGMRLMYFDQRHAIKIEASGKVASDTEAHSKLPSLQTAVAGYAAATIAILVAAPLVASASEGLAEATGLGGTFVGTTLVAFATSSPEIVTTLAAVRAGAFDLAVGNIFGSNTFNMTILLAGDFFYDGSILDAASPTHAFTAACVIIVTAVATLALLYRAEKRYWLIEPDALLVIVLVLGSLGLVYSMR
jgi:cation:H+ antiporter